MRTFVHSICVFGYSVEVGPKQSDDDDAVKIVTCPHGQEHLGLRYRYAEQVLKGEGLALPIMLADHNDFKNCPHCNEQFPTQDFEDGICAWCIQDQTLFPELMESESNDNPDRVS